MYKRILNSLFRPEIFPISSFSFSKNPRWGGKERKEERKKKWGRTERKEEKSGEGQREKTE